MNQYTPNPFDERDKQFIYTMWWIGVTALFAGLIIIYDVIASEQSVFLTYSFNGGYYFVRAPWLVWAIVGTIAHMAMQQVITVAEGWSVGAVLLITGVYAVIWHTGQYLEWWTVMRYWTMYGLNFVVAPLVWSTVFALRLTY